jgi:hypothetical protein
VLGEKRSNGEGYLARDLSIDQTPYICVISFWGGVGGRGVGGVGVG